MEKLFILFIIIYTIFGLYSVYLNNKLYILHALNHSNKLDAEIEKLSLEFFEEWTTRQCPHEMKNTMITLAIEAQLRAELEIKKLQKELEEFRSR
jgi:hypothetical protein